MPSVSWKNQDIECPADVALAPQFAGRKDLKALPEKDTQAFRWAWAKNIVSEREIMRATGAWELVIHQQASQDTESQTHVAEGILAGWTELHPALSVSLTPLKGGARRSDGRPEEPGRRESVSQRANLI